MGIVSNAICILCIYHKNSFLKTDQANQNELYL